MKTNPYHKNCPHCQKDFNARRLNQKYCTYFCKVQFNNERAKLRRLELLEMAKRNQPTTSKNLISENVHSPTPPNHIEKNRANHSSIPKDEDSKFFKKAWKWLAFLLGIGVMISVVYYFFIKKDKATNPPKTFAKNENIRVSPNSTSAPPIVETDKTLSIPTEIYPIETDLNCEIPNSSSENIKNPQHYFQEEHPDILGYKKILEAHMRI